MTTVVHSVYLAQRLLRALFRQPWFIVSTMVQPMIWLLLYGELFKRVTELPGFGAGSYITFLTPGVVVMTALFSGGWTGMGQLRDMHSGALDRFLVSPVSRVALIGGRLISVAVLTLVQSLILLGCGWVMGARFPGGVTGVAVLILVAVLLSASIGAVSSCLALWFRKQESLVAASNLILLPLTFMSPVFMAKDVMPDWIRFVSRLNPVNWSVEAARAALVGGQSPLYMASQVGCLLAFTVVSVWLAKRAFHLYQNSI